MKRISLLKAQLNKFNIEKNSINSKLETINMEINPMDELLNEDEKKYLLKFRDYAAKHLSKEILFPYSEKTELPLKLIHQMQKELPEVINLDLQFGNSPFISKNLAVALGIESGKIDQSVFTFCFVHGRLCTGVINAVGSKEQKEKYIPDMFNLKKIGSFCLTERDIGSEAHNLQTTFEELEDGDFIINGNKRWIGNATLADVLIVFAKEKIPNNNQSRKPRICGFLVEPKNPNHNPTGKNIVIKKIENKLAFRMVQNADIELTNVRVSKEFILEKMSSFDDITDHLVLSRLNICYPILGILIGAYQKALKYSLERTQFKRQIGSYQLIQEKLVIIRSNIEAIFSLVRRITEYSETRELSQGRAGMAKSWVSHLARDSLMLARDILGGNGILFENQIMTSIMDLEALITVEGTYEVNILACGREITGGIPAFY